MHKLNPNSRWRLDLATQISHRICSFEGLQAIVVGGSVARGYADPYSDLELPLFWSAPPSNSVRKAIIAVLQAELLDEYDGSSKEDNLLVNGFQVDVWHNTVPEEEIVIDNVLQRFATDLSSNNFMDTVRVCIPLYGEPLIQGWKQRAQVYPDELAVRSIQEHIAHFLPGQLDIHAERDNPNVFYGLISGLQRRVFLVLLALNREYFPSFKWMFRALEAMSVKPANVTARFRSAFSDPRAAATRDTLQVLDETLALVHERYPQIDIARVQRRLGRNRIAHHTPVKIESGE